MRRLVPLLLTLTAEVAAVVVLHRAWSPPDDLLGRVLWVAAVAGAWWLLASTVLPIVAHVSRRAGALRASARISLPGVRRFAERTLAASIVAGGLLMAPAAASAPTAPTGEARSEQASEPAAEPVVDPSAAPEPDADPEPKAPIRTGRVGDPQARTAVSTQPTKTEPPKTEPTETKQKTPPAPEAAPASGHTPAAPSGPASGKAGTTPSTTVPGPSTPTPAVPDAPTSPTPNGGGAAPATAPSAPTPAAPNQAAPAGITPPSTHTVVIGDNLWAIAAAHLAATTGRTSFGDGEVAAYWRRVCDTNRAHLRSGDVNLIFVGEVIELPPI